MKRYLLAALLALTLHGLLFAIQLPGQQGKIVRPAAIPVEIEIRQLQAKPAAPTKKVQPKPLPEQTPVAPRRPPLKKRKPVRRERVPPQKEVEENPPAEKKTALAQRQKESNIETERKKNRRLPQPHFPPDKGTSAEAQPVASATDDEKKSGSASKTRGRLPGNENGKSHRTPAGDPGLSAQPAA